MAITVEWDNLEQTVLRLTFIGGWNWNELFRAIDVAEAMSMQRLAKVDAIIDLSDAETLPAGLVLDPTFRANAQKLARRATGQHGRIIVVGATPWMASLYNMFRGLLGERVGRVAFSQSIPEALDWLKAASESESPLQPTPAEVA